MRNQFQTDPVAEPITTPLTPHQAELANTETQETPETQTTRERLAKIQGKIRRSKKRASGLQNVALVFSALPMISLLFFSSSPLAAFLMEHLVLYLFAVAVLFFLTLTGSFTKSSWSGEELAQIGGVEVVGTLLETLQMPEGRKQYKSLLLALTNLLPQMKASDARFLTAGQRKLLYRTLAFGSSSNSEKMSTVHQNYLVALLKALEQIGDADALPIVTRIANGHGQTDFQQRLKAAAEQCLPLLEIHLSKAEQNQTLLRASSAKHSSPELLRPVEFTPEANPKQLLRATEESSPLPPAP